MVCARRSFLALIPGGLLLLLLGDAAALLGRRREKRRRTALERALARLFPDPRSARAIGSAYLQSHHPGGGAPALPIPIEDSGFSEGGLTREAFAARTRRDFAEGRIVHVRGWILSETEARVCALTTLIFPGRSGRAHA